MRARIPVLLSLICIVAPGPVSAQRPADRLALHRLVGEEILAQNALKVCKQAARLPAEERFEFLCRWVLPSEEHPTFRLVGDFHCTAPAPPVNFRATGDVALSHTPSVTSYLQGREALALPALDLIDAARTSGRLKELHERVLTSEPADIEHRRSKFAMLFLSHAAQGDYPAAEQAFEQFISLDRDADRNDLRVRWRDVLILWSSFTDNRARQIVHDYFFSYYADTGKYYPDPRYDVLTDYVRALHGISRQLDSGIESKNVLSELSGATRGLLPFGYGGAFHHAHGRPTALWALGAGEAWKFAGHELDYLSYQVPLRGDYVVECDVSSGDASHNTFMVAGKRVEYIGHNHTIAVGTFRFGGEHLPIEPPRVTIQEWVRHRAVVKDGKLSHFINGRKVLEHTLSPHHAPWIAIGSWRRSHGGFRNLRILGNPAIPDELHLTGDPELAGWAPYHETGFGHNKGFWSAVAEPTGGYGLSGYYRSDMVGTGMEQLIRYIRPMVEGGTIEYDFFYQEGKFGVHPALDRLAFLLQPEGVRIHWIADGAHDRTGLDAWNSTLERENQRGPGRLPLIENDWNHVRLTLQGQSVQLALNGQLVYERTLESDNRLTFGLFHYCGETQAHARNVIWRGNWPKTLPPLEERQFKHSITAKLDAERDRLPAVFRHEFANGLPPKLFAVEGDKSYLKLLDRGVYVERAEQKGVLALETSLKMSGDFDVVLTFEDLDINLPVFLERTGIGLAVSFDNAQADEYRLFRRNGRSAADQRAEFEHLSLGPNGERRYNGGRHIGEAANAGRLRLARRKETVYALFAEFDSPDYRLVSQRSVSADAALPQGLKLITDSARYLRTSAVFTKLEIRAERLDGLPVPAP